MHKCHTMMVRKRMAVSRLRRIAEDGEVVLEDETQGIELGGKKFQETSEPLDGERRFEIILEGVWTKGSFCKVKIVYI